MGGIPPLAGFFSKYYILLNAAESQLHFLVFIGLFTSCISIYYYLRIVKSIWFENNVHVVEEYTPMRLDFAPVLIIQ